MVSVASHRIPRVPRYSGTGFESSSFSPTWLSHAMAPLSRGLRLTTGLVTLLLPALQPLKDPKILSGLGYVRFRSPLLSESRLLSFPPGTEMVHFPGFAHTCLCIQQAVKRFYLSGFPHSEIPGYNACLRLPGAYRSLPRPSSPSSAKASTMRP
jgi:hypothetical protein